MNRRIMIGVQFTIVDCPQCGQLIPSILAEEIKRNPLNCGLHPKFSLETCDAFSGDDYMINRYYTILYLIEVAYRENGIDLLADDDNGNNDETKVTFSVN